MGFVWSDKVLVFVYRPVGMPKMEKVYLHNPSSEQISLISISATTAHFHASFFQNRVSTNYFDLLCFFVTLYLLPKSKLRFHGFPSPVQVFFLKIEQSQLLTCHVHGKIFLCWKGVAPLNSANANYFFFLLSRQLKFVTVKMSVLNTFCMKTCESVPFTWAEKSRNFSHKVRVKVFEAQAVFIRMNRLTRVESFAFLIIEAHVYIDKSSDNTKEVSYGIHFYATLSQGQEAWCSILKVLYTAEQYITFSKGCDYTLVIWQGVGMFLWQQLQFPSLF